MDQFVEGLTFNNSQQIFINCIFFFQGKLMIMTDQDQDGSHIKGLLINFIHHNWPELLQQEFLEEFITPIVKVTKNNRELSFYSLPEFDEWQRDTPNSKSWKVKYYKGVEFKNFYDLKYFMCLRYHVFRFPTYKM